MASSGKKGKKSKGKTLALTDFLQETPGATPNVPIRKSLWSDEVEDDYNDGGGRSRGAANVVLPTAPKAARGLDDYGDKVPDKPPFMAYLSNLPYDVDEDEIAEFFGNMKVRDLRLPKDDRSESTRLKGYGYVEFEDKESLLEALSIPDSTLKGRRIRIELSSSSDGDRRRGGGRMDMNRDMNRDRPEVTMGDWRSGPRTESSFEGGGGGGRPRGGDREGGGGFSRDREGGGGGGFSRDRGGDREREPRETDDKPGAWRSATDRPKESDRFSRDDRDKGRSFTRDYDRNRDSYGGDRDRDRGGDRGDRGGYGSRRDGGRDERNGGGGGGGGGMTRGPPREESATSAPSSESRTRPKLNLAPRTKPIEDLPPPTTESDEAPAAAVSDDNPPPSTTPVTTSTTTTTEDTSEASTEPTTVDPPPSADSVDTAESVATPVAVAPPPAVVRREPVSSASIFGSAKPVDTSARERQIEERLAKREEGSMRDGDRREFRRGGGEDDRRRDNGRSPGRRGGSPPDRRHGSPPGDRRDNSDRDIRRGGGGAPTGDIAPARREEKPRQQREPPTEREMPKVKESEPVNYVAPNKYAFLPTEGDSEEETAVE